MTTKHGTTLRNTGAAAILCCLIAPLQVSAHHGSNSNPALYLADNLVEFEGEVSGVLWRNPHPRLMVTVVGDDGEALDWELEFGGSVNSYLNEGVGRDFFREGDRVRAAGVVSRRDPQSIGLLHLLLPSGEEMVHGDRELRWSDELFTPGGPAPSSADVRTAEASANGIFRIWGRRTSGRPRAADYADHLTERGRELAAQYYGPRDNPEFECRTGIPTHMFDPTPMEITDGGDRIHIETLEYNVKRVIYLTDDRPAPTSSNVGYSVGRWEGNTLVVETTHIDWPYFDPYGTPQSDQMSYVETFRVADDESRLDYRLVATDPINFSEPVTLERSWLWEPGREMYEFDCVAEWENE